MQKVVVVVDDVNALKWPGKCPGCGTALEDGAALTIDVMVERDVRALFASLKPKSLPVNLCNACQRRISGNTHLVNFLVKRSDLGPDVTDPKLHIKYQEAVGNKMKLISGSLALLTFYALFFMTYEAALGFLVSFLIAKLIQIRLEKIYGVACLRESKDRWRFCFQNDVFARAFAGLNAHFKQLE